MTSPDNENSMLADMNSEVSNTNTCDASEQEHKHNGKSNFVECLKCFPKATAQKLCFPTLDDEKAFLYYQIFLRETETRALHEAMDVLDIIDCKTQALLAYISISFAALVFLLTGFKENANIKLMFFDEATLTMIILIFLIVLSVAIVLCLSCLNIVGAHTIRNLKSQEEQKRLEEYETLIIKVTLSRRTRYIIAQRISIMTAVCLGLLFFSLILGDLHAQWVLLWP